ncbi:hypothetical protein Talka_02326 [Tepidimonas alkaliphilus]|uniref:Uncharacterized protein n=1 Tax=Tepidimonas alkaliphilus TaxID=2588942 RepID=A0A554W3P3_9BURK|nr:hypothetical protein Talka_02326 [Tepidimonas alkaliphilus]
MVEQTCAEAENEVFKQAGAERGKIDDEAFRERLGGANMKGDGIRYFFEGAIEFDGGVKYFIGI